MSESINPSIITRRSLNNRQHFDTLHNNTDCPDCACSIPQHATQAIFDQAENCSPWVKSEPNFSQSLSLDHTLIYGPFQDIVVLNPIAVELWNQFDKPAYLPSQFSDRNKSTIISQFIRAGMIRPYNSEPRELVEQPDFLSVWLHLTDKCNLRCHYCYLPHVNKNMSPDIGLAAIDATFRSAIAYSYKNITIKYAGGEALLDLSLILLLHKYALKLGSKHGICVKGVVLSNGTLVDHEIATILSKNDLQLMISLDGIKGEHDNQRPFAGGRGSFEAAKKGVQAALDVGVSLSISVTVTSRNASAIAKLIEWVLMLEIPFTLNFYRENALSQHISDLALDDQIIIDGMLAAYAEIEKRLPRRSMLDSIADRANLSAPHLRTCGVGRNYMVFDYNGKISKCQMQMNQVVTNINAPNPLLSVRADSSGIINLSVNQKTECSICDWKYWCTGGCSIMTYQSSGKFNDKSPYCSIYKAIFPAAMRLEGLRLLKYGDWL